MPHTTAPLTDKGRERVLRLLSLACFASMASMRWCDSLLPALATEFSRNPGQTGSVIYGFALAYGAMQLFYGPFGDRLGKLHVVSLAVLACTIGALAGAFASSLGWLTAARVLNGAAAAGVIPLTLAWVGDNISWEQRQPALARVMTATLLGMICGQWLAGLFADTLGWRVGFVALALLFGGVGLTLRLSIRAKLEGTQRPPSVGSGDASAAGSSNATTPASHVGKMGAVLKSRSNRLFLGFIAAEGAFAFSAMAFAPTHLHDRFGLAVSVAGGILAVYGLGGLLYTFGVRWLMARLSGPAMARLGGLMAGCAWILFAFVPAWIWSIPLCALAGLGFYMIHSTLQTQATEMAPHLRGTAVSLFACTLFFGQSVGMSLAAVLIDRWSTGPVLASCGFGLLVIGLAANWVVKAPASRPLGSSKPS